MKKKRVPVRLFLRVFFRIQEPVFFSEYGYLDQKWGLHVWPTCFLKKLSVPRVHRSVRENPKIPHDHQRIICVWVRAALCSSCMVDSYVLTMALKYLHARKSECAKKLTCYIFLCFVATSEGRDRQQEFSVRKKIQCFFPRAATIQSLSLSRSRHWMSR